MRNRARRYERYQRDSATKKRYGRTWKRIRDRYIAVRPLHSEEVHHIKPLSKGGTNEVSNLMALCTSCHSGISAREGGRWNKRNG